MVELGELFVMFVLGVWCGRRAVELWALWLTIRAEINNTISRWRRKDVEKVKEAKVEKEDVK